MIERITFITIGQTPRTDLVPEIVAGLPSQVAVREVGALDGMEPDEIADLVPGPDDHALVTRLRDGSQAIIGKRWVTARLQEILDGIAPDAREVTVLLCTGDFSSLRGPELFLDAQHLVDHGVDALCQGARVVGMVVPLARQEDEHHYHPAPGQRLRTAHASPYEEVDFAGVGRALEDCRLIVMHCMGYTEAQRRDIALGAGRPVLLARRLVTAALAQLL